MRQTEPTWAAGSPPFMASWLKVWRAPLLTAHTSVSCAWVNAVRRAFGATIGTNGEVKITAAL